MPNPATGIQAEKKIMCVKCKKKLLSSEIVSHFLSHTLNEEQKEELNAMMEINKKENGELASEPASQNEQEALMTAPPTNESQLARSKYTGKGTEVECKICLVNYTEQDTLVYLPCMHFYHEECILDWFGRLEMKLVSPSCPICLKQTFNY
eukprot:TRINITY_DN1387_c0_g2_i4.p1 TRINITY_DN1387_c0_g2~~TRINITY_DN1387_c0_g2_i4.p1  ORF type:complete len:151 (+),score=44.66 TRINITY_DN1387_c0_g2_i4:241-693(+)